MGNVVIDYNNPFYFLHYFIPTALVFVAMSLRIPLLKGVLVRRNPPIAISSRFVLFENQCTCITAI